MHIYMVYLSTSLKEPLINHKNAILHFLWGFEAIPMEKGQLPTFRHVEKEREGAVILLQLGCVWKIPKLQVSQKVN